MKSLIAIISIIIFSFLFPSLSFASIVEGTIDPVYKYAWGEKIGWVNFGCKNCNVKITDSEVSGYAWSENYGWINLSPEKGGVKNTPEGNLSGYAWGENLGWIDFSGVWIDATGRWKGSASSSIAGEINFDCDYCVVKTDWRPSSLRPACSNGIDDDGDGKIDYPEDPGCTSIFDDDESEGLAIVSGGEASSDAPPSEEEKEEKKRDKKKAEFKVLINDGAEVTQIPMVTLKLLGGEEGMKMSISNDPQFKDESSVKEIPYSSSYFWNLCLGRAACPEGKYTVYVRFLTSEGEIVATVSDSIIYQKSAVKETSSLLEKLKETLISLLPSFLKPKPPLPEEVPPLVPLPEKAPLVFEKGWKLLPSEPIREFVFESLPKEITELVRKFPKIRKIFSSLGISNLADLPKLKTLKLSLPTFTEAVGFPKGAIESKKLLAGGGIPLDYLTPSFKEKIPPEVVFVKTGKGWIDLSLKLTVDRRGNVHHKLRTISGAPLELIVKPAEKANQIKGYILFVSLKPKVERAQASFSKILNFLPLALAQEKEENLSSNGKFVLSEFEYQDLDGDGIWTAKIHTPPLEGEYEIVSVIEYQDPRLEKKEIKFKAIVDPEGYVYEKYKDKEVRIPGALVFLYWLNPETKKYQLWPAEEYGQENPYVTDTTGRYSFLVPPGFYYLRVEASGYLPYQSKPFQVKESKGVYLNIELKSKYWFLKKIDWTTVLLIFLTILLIYNFYRDKMREKKFESYK